MARKRHTAEEIVAKLRQAACLGNGHPEHANSRRIERQRQADR